MEVSKEYENEKRGLVELRRHPRYKLEAELRVYGRSQGLVVGRTVDISESGVAAMLKLEVPLGELAQLEFRVPLGKVSVWAVVKQRSAFRYGFQFTEPNEIVRQTCRQLAVEESLKEQQKL